MYVVTTPQARIYRYRYCNHLSFSGATLPLFRRHVTADVYVNTADRKIAIVPGTTGSRPISFHGKGKGAMHQGQITISCGQAFKKLAIPKGTWGPFPVEQDGDGLVIVIPEIVRAAQRPQENEG